MAVEPIIISSVPSFGELMSQSGINQKELARRLGKSEAWVSSLMRKSFEELTVGQVDEICYAIGYKVEIKISSNI